MLEYAGILLKSTLAFTVVVAFVVVALVVVAFVVTMLVVTFSVGFETMLLVEARVVPFSEFGTVTSSLSSVLCASLDKVVAILSMIAFVIASVVVVVLVVVVESGFSTLRP